MLNVNQYTNKSEKPFNFNLATQHQPQLFQTGTIEMKPKRIYRFNYRDIQESNYSHYMSLPESKIKYYCAARQRMVVSLP